MRNVLHKLRIIFGDKSLRNRIFFTLGALVVFRLLSAIPIPGVDQNQLAAFLASNQLVGVLNIFSGGGLSNLSIIMLGVGAYVTSSIIMQVMTIMFPKLKSMYQEEGEAGRKKFTQYSRMLTVPLAAIQGFGLLTLLERQGALGTVTTFQMITNLSIVIAGAMLTMWIGELISEYGIGNGVSVLIFGGIVASFPTSVSQALFTYTPADLPLYIAFVLVGLIVIAGVVLVTEAERPIPVTYAKQVHGNHVTGGTSTYIPLRLTQAGVIPIIFALSILLFPQIIANFLAGSTNAILLSISNSMTAFLQNQLLYGAVYFVLVFLFTYFYTAVTFDPESMSHNLQKNGAFIPGVRPGQSTAEYVSKILTRVTLVGALFLGVIAILPLIMQSITGITQIALGGTSLLIVINVAVDLVKKIDAQIAMREY
ncbi:MAG: preprotein translocase subunit SecY [Candidatus Pacebacteria bacterium]|nr:preprotein translocase subunit SecY [Candidatus Paceibacterota bacterium]MBP9780665.1 preprotein translocase subunit SecY [Candidatus Paceibacterota bacterium]